MRLPETAKYAVAGGLAGIANGFFGGGGGMVLVPLLTHWIGLEERRAFATSVAVILPLCAVSAAVYLMRADISLLSALPYLLGGLLGGFLGGKVFRKVPANWLRRIFGVLILYAGIKSLL
ncbi:MAG: sulfite exporter TauE/SafE family protein [Oscillospiraceae bacterium]|nr:sulfite exporter TauE/SafE family protein [Oscillospiraceae bacterium]